MTCGDTFCGKLLCGCALCGEVYGEVCGGCTVCGEVCGGEGYDGTVPGTLLYGFALSVVLFSALFCGGLCGCNGFDTSNTCAFCASLSISLEIALPWLHNTGQVTRD